MLVYATTDGGLSELAHAVARRDSDWVAPGLWKSEYRNVMAGYVRRDAITVARASDLVDRASALLVAETSPDTTLVFKLVETSKCSAYDLEFVACALELEVPLVTNDRRILESFPDVAVSPAEFVAGTPPAGSSG